MAKKTPTPYDAPELKYTEWWASGELKEWIDEVCKDKGLRYYAHIEREVERKRPDILIFDEAKKPVCLVEVKPPSWDPITIDLVKGSFFKADRVKAPYFATWNINKFVLFNTAEFDKTRLVREGIIQIYDVTDVAELKDIEESEHKIKIRSFLEAFLEELVLIYEGRKVVPKIPIDEYFISHLRLTVEALTNSYRGTIAAEAEKNVDLKREITKWFTEQMWSFSGSKEDYAKIARQAAYLLINKVLFYTALQEKFDLDPLEVPKNMRKGDVLEQILKAYFGQILKVDYETIFTTEFIDELAFPKDEKAVEAIRDLIGEINVHKISTIGYDFLGNLFETLIPEKERHILGQYFTNSDVVDLILNMCLKSEHDFVLDPGCGAGTFLVRAYRHKQIMNPRLKHEEILARIWGVDISKFASHLSTINLAIKDLGVKENYPRIVHSDFFEVKPPGIDMASIHFDVPKKITVTIQTLGVEEKEIEYPESFDCVVGNPPYTRQEEIEELAEEGYKENLIEKALSINDKKLAEITRRAGIHAYFFVHGFKFLKEGGRFGFVVSNSWLDVDWGGGLQEFFLRYYKILAIVESKVERWFVDADVNTCIVILERCENEERRKENIVRFVQLKKPLRHFIPKAEKEWDKEVKRLQEIDKLVKLILAHSDYYENEEIRIYPKIQEELWKEGYDEDLKKYTGSKWGKYVRAPEIFFTIMERGKDLFVPLKEVAEVRRGFTTGANEFFYLTEEEIEAWGIEKEFWCHKEGKEWVPNYVIKSPRECTGIVVKPENLKFRVLMIHKDKKELEGTNVLKYLEYGEGKGFHERPTCKSRERWYELPILPHADVLFRQFFNVIFNFPLKEEETPTDHTFYYLCLHNKTYSKAISAFLNSAFYNMIVELYGRTVMGEGVLIAYGPEIEPIPLIDPAKLSKLQHKKLSKAFGELSTREIGSVFDEFGAENPEEVTLDKVKSDRRELDKVIFEILGLTEEEQLEVYKAVVDLVRSRIEKAKSVLGNKNKRKVSEVDLVVKRTLDSLGGEDILKNFFAGLGEYEEIFLPRFKKEAEIEKTLTGWQLTDGKERVFFDDRKHAEYCRILASIGMEKAKIPKEMNEEKLTTLQNIVNSVFQALSATLGTIIDKKTREAVRGLVIGKIISKTNETSTSV